MVKNIFKSKKFLLVVFVVLIVGSIVAALLLFKEPTSNQQPTEKQATDTSQSSDTSSKDPAPAQQQLTAPEPKVPDMCSKVTDSVKQVIGDGLKTSGSSATTNANSKVTDCNYSKATQLINVKVYEYKSDSEAKADLSKIQPKGFSGQNKGKYNVVVSAVVASTNTSGADIATSDKIVKLIAEKL